MPANFAALQARVNAAAIRHLADVEAVYTPVGGGPQDDPVPGEFDSAYISVSDDGVSSTSPALFVDLADMPSPQRDDQLVINGVTYDTVEVLPDGGGMAILRLRLAS
jgi:hypothetical protein